MWQQQYGIAGLRIDKRIARLNAFWVTLALGGYLVLGSWWILAVLAVDFFLRGFLRGRMSPIGAASRGAAAFLSGRPQLQWAAPKVFAAKLGCAISLIALLVQTTGAVIPAKVLVAGLIVLTSLEAFTGYCVACQIHSALHRARAFHGTGRADRG